MIRYGLCIIEFETDQDVMERIVVECRPLAGGVRSALLSLLASGVSAASVCRIYCEIQPADLPGNYLRTWLRREFSSTKVTWSFEYGETAGSRSRGRQRWAEAVGNLGKSG